MSVIRKLLESLGLVREEAEQEHRYAAADAAIADARTVTDAARRRRGLSDEDRSYRPPAGTTHP